MAASASASRSEVKKQPPRRGIRRERIIQAVAIIVVLRFPSFVPALVACRGIAQEWLA